MKLSIKAILVGWAVYLAGSLIIGIPIGLLVGVSVARGVKSEQIAARMASLPMHEISLLIALIMSILGGWVAASIARRHALLHGAATGVLSIVMYWLMMILMSSATSPVWYHMITTVLTIPCAMLGAYLRGQKSFAEIDSVYGGSTPPIPEA